MFSKKSTHDFTAQDFLNVINNLKAQQELVKRRLEDRSMSQETAEEEQKRLSKLITAYTKNLDDALSAEQSNTLQFG
ncbi:hypothetical protein [Legionella waltersii]|uniref:Uncharacterized protein n=1 Tax=Legionella waltersii TaxID=66969 RepID=A0A0W1AMH6_9GAMM|nr:hypothetical protein [Legionella waltersii]KTD82571.1 hypothetical protein Lwal_0500 [Legionella waltersii]SNV02467.1 Uncharacterised protein [Legionella waltersii]